MRDDEEVNDGLSRGDEKRGVMRAAG